MLNWVAEDYAERKFRLKKIYLLKKTKNKRRCCQKIGRCDAFSARNASQRPIRRRRNFFSFLYIFFFFTLFSLLLSLFHFFFPFFLFFLFFRFPILPVRFFFLFFFFCNLRNAPDASVVMVDDERNTFYHHHGCVEAQSLRLVNAYLADKGIDGHQQVLLIPSASRVLAPMMANR